MKACLYTILMLLIMSGAARAQEEMTQPAGKASMTALSFDAADLKIEGADEARDSGKLMRALSLYREAHRMYRELARRHPEQDAILVEFRADYCRDQMDNIAKILAINGVTVDQEPGVRSPGFAEATPGTQESALEPEPKPSPTPEPEPVAVPEPVPEPVPDPVSEPRPEPMAAGGIAGMAADGRQALKKGDLPKARAFLMKALSENPDDRKVRLLLAMVQCRAGRFEDATYLLVELIGESPDNAMAHVALGTAYFGMGRIEDASKLMKRAIELDRTLHEAHYNMAQILLSTKPADLDGAREYYKKALELGGKKDEKLEFLLK